jgi:hypothetical protein
VQSAGIVAPVEGGPVFNAGGPTPKVIQAAARLAYLPRLKFLTDMIDGNLEREVKILTGSGKTSKLVTLKVKPTFQERLDAMKELGRVAQAHTPTEGDGGNGNASAFVSRALNALAQLAAGVAANGQQAPRLAEQSETEPDTTVG